MKATSIALLVATLGITACEKDGAPNADGDSTSRFERGVAKVGEKLETAAEDVGTEVRESRIQMVIDNIKGLDSVQAEITDDGLVTLIGNVASAEIGTRAYELVQSIEGVDNVRNSLTVGSVPMVDTASAGPGMRDTTSADSSKRTW